MLVELKVGMNLTPVRTGDGAPGVFQHYDAGTRLYLDDATAGCLEQRHLVEQVKEPEPHVFPPKQASRSYRKPRRRKGAAV